MSDTTLPLRRDLTVMGLVGAAHAASHFFHLVLPSLFLILRDVFGVSYAELGLLTTLFFVASGICQTIAGFLVDHFGARRVLLAGLTLLSVMVICYGFVTEFWMLYPLVILAGCGNSVFHPADLSILTSKVSPSRLGRAYGVHALSGNLGWASAPLFVVTIAHLYDWRTALIAAGCLGLIIVAAFLAWGGDLADKHVERAAASKETPTDAPAEPLSKKIRLLFSVTILSCFAYFACLAAALIGVQTFGVTAMTRIYDVDLAFATTALTAFLVSSATGILFGGFAADHTDRHDRVAMLGMFVAGVVFVAVGAGMTPDYLLLVMLAFGGFFAGMTSPSRDMLVRKATPKGASGRVFGFVYSGLDLGSSMMPLALGWIMDRGHPDMVFYAVAFFLVLTIVTVVQVRSRADIEQAAAT